MKAVAMILLDESQVSEQIKRQSQKTLYWARPDRLTPLLRNILQIQKLAWVLLAFVRVLK